MKAPVRVLLSSAGRRVELLDLFSAAEVAHVTVLTADAAPESSAACYRADQSFRVPPVTSDEFIPALKELCCQQDVDVLVPTIDPELPPLASAAGEFEHTWVVVGSVEAVGVASDKMLTAQALGAAGLPVPKTVRVDEEALAEMDPPFVLKPALGSSSVGVHVVERRDEVPTTGLNGYVAQALVRGVECTVNCFTSQGGVLLAAVPHTRLAVRAGEVARGETIRHPGLDETAERLVAAVPGLRGPFCFQAFIEGSKVLGVIEINPRFGGGYPLAHAAGANFVELIIRQRLGLETEGPEWRAGVRMLRYDQSIFLG